MIISPRSFKVLLAVLSVTSIVSCGASAPNKLIFQAVDGKVFNSDTKEPIAGAIVVLKWTGMPVRSILDFNGHSSPSASCYHVESAVTDATGHYHVPAWEQEQKYSLEDGLFEVMAYKKGYTQTKGGGAGGKYYSIGTHLPILYLKRIKNLTPDVEMKPFSGTPEQRSEDLHSYDLFCELAKGNARNFIPIANAIVDELSQHEEIPVNKIRIGNLKDYSKYLEERP